MVVEPKPHNESDPVIMYSDNELVVINKPAGLLVHSAAHMILPHGPTLTQWIVKNFPQTKAVGDNPVFRPGIVHRLDKETSGVMLIALTQEMFEYLKQCFKEGMVKKEYVAIVAGTLDKKEGSIDLPIGVKAGTTRRTTHGGKDIKQALTLYKQEQVVEKESGIFSVVRVFPQTGRTHQIRVHLNAINHPIIGDQMYGGKTNAGLAPRLMLHAHKLAVSLPGNKRMTFEAPLPAPFVDFLASA